MALEGRYLQYTRQKSRVLIEWLVEALNGFLLNTLTLRKLKYSNPNGEEFVLDPFSRCLIQSREVEYYIRGFRIGLYWWRKMEMMMIDR